MFAGSLSSAEGGFCLRDGRVQAKERGRAACYAMDVTAADAP